MAAPSTPGLFITGTDTAVGKTHVAAAIARQLTVAGRRVGVYKPVASGCWLEGETLVSDDARRLWLVAGRLGELNRVCPQRFAAPLAPHLAARLTGQSVDARLLRSGVDYWRDQSQIVIVEGAGGLLSPVSDTDLAADVARDLGYPLVLVARNALGTINHTLLTLEAARQRGLRVAAVVLNDATLDPNDPSRQSNADELRARIGQCVFTTLGHSQRDFSPGVDWGALAASPS